MKTLKYSLLLMVLIHCQSKGQQYINYISITTEIDNSLKEHEKQKALNKNVIQTAGLETNNNSEWKKLKDITQKIRGRLNNLSFAIQAVPTAKSIVDQITEIKKIQQEIYNYLWTSPTWILLALPQQVDFLNDLNMNIRLITGIVLSYGIINQMEKAERKTLLDYVEQEMINLKLHCSHILLLIKNANKKIQDQKDHLEYWVNKDKKIVQSLIKTIKSY